MSKISLQLTNQVGMRLSVEVDSMEDVYATMRTYGSRGWTSGEIPAGGVLLPYDMANDFDWALIGARHFTYQKDNETVQAVEHKGLVYTRREYTASTGAKKMPAKIKYSRGVKPTDPPHIREGDEDGIQYVTLASFVGKGPIVAALKKPPERAAA